jgi:hypothetical protein
VLRRSLNHPFSLASLAIVAGFLSAAPSAPAAARTLRRPRQPKIVVSLPDTGKTIALSLGEELVVLLPMKTFNDNSWYIYRNSGVPLKLIAGPNEIRGRRFKPWSKGTAQRFYFRKESPGTTHLVLKQNYWSRPMILKVVDSPPLPPPSAAFPAATSADGNEAEGRAPRRTFRFRQVDDPTG